MRTSALAFSLVATVVLRADDWELSAFQSTQKIPSHGSLLGATVDPHGFRLGYALGAIEKISFRVEGTWMPRSGTEIHALDPHVGLVMPVGRLMTRSETLSLRAESWFWEGFVCVSASVDQRLNHVDYHPVNGSTVMGYGDNRLPQTWLRAGLGGRIWFFGMADLGRDRDSSWYPIARLEWAAAVSPKGESLAAKCLPRKEFVFSLGFRF